MPISCQYIDHETKNVLQFVLEPAHQEILYKVTSAHADINSCYWCDGGFIIQCSSALYKFK